MGRAMKVVEPVYGDIRVVLDKGLYLDGMSTDDVRQKLDLIDVETAEKGLFNVQFDVDEETGYYGDRYTVISVVGYRKETPKEYEDRKAKETSETEMRKQNDLKNLQALAKKLNVKIELPA